MASKPTIVLVPGSSTSGGLMWGAVQDELLNAGYDALALELPTVSHPSTAPAKTMSDDAAIIHGVVEALANDGKDILLVMSSYGGIPGTQSLAGVTRKEREALGKKGGVTGLVYVAALLVNKGESSADSFAAYPMRNDFVRVSGDYMTIDPATGAPLVFNELPKEVGEAHVRKMPGHSLLSFREKMTGSSHYDVPVTYLKCTEDNIVQPAHQQKMIEDFRAVSRSAVVVVERPYGHGPMTERPGETAEIIVDAARGI